MGVEVQGSEPSLATVTLEPSSVASQVATTQLLTATDILYSNELRRGRLWVMLSGYLAGIGLGAALLAEAPRLSARLPLAVGCGVLLIASLFGWRILSRRDHYDAAEAALYSYVSLACVLPAYHFFGWFSPVLVVVCLGGVIFAMGHSPRAVIAMAATTSASHATIGGLTIAGVLPDVGIASMSIDGTAHALLVLAGSQALFAFAFIIGRQLRVHSLDGVERYGAAVRESTRREVLLQEAIDELHRVRKVGDPGRFTGLELGSFRLGVVLGCGGMGDVYEANHLSTGEPAAVKVLTSGPRDESAARRFAREISLAAVLDSPHIVRVLEHSASDDAIPYLAMERLQGATLAEELRGRLDLRGILRMLREVAEGVDTAHEAGVIHRDLKPQNLFHHVADGDDIWKVLDFGVSKLADAQSSLTGFGLLGTPAYMSPEQATGLQVDYRSDLFALGSIAYRSLTGRPAFFGSDMAAILRRVSRDMPLRPSAAAPLPLEVDLVLAIALAKAPGERFESAFELAAALTKACSESLPTELHHRAEALLLRSPWADPAAPA